MFARHDIAWTDLQVRNFWDYNSRSPYASTCYFTRIAGDAILRYLNAHIALKGLKLLDFGCGPGYLMDAIARGNYDVKYYGLDFSPESVKALKAAHAPKRQFGGAFAVSSLPAEISERFELVISCEVIEHLGDEPLKAMATESLRLLKPGGTLFVTTPNDEDLAASGILCPECGAVFHRWQHMRHWTPDSVRAYFEACGFRTQHVQTLNFGRGRIDYWARWLAKHLLRLDHVPTKQESLVYFGTKP